MSGSVQTKEAYQDRDRTIWKVKNASKPVNSIYLGLTE